MKRISRRQLMGDSLLAATAAAAAHAAATGSARAQDKPAGRKVGANDRLRVAVIGFHGRGRSHISGFAGRKETEIVALCDVDKAIWGRGIKAVEGRGGNTPVCHQDLRRILDDKSIDIVTIATPNHWHSLAAIWAMQAGKDVYVEKPVSHNVSEGRRVVEAARRYGKICQTGTQCRSNPGTIDAVRFVHDGRIGKLEVARGLCYKSRRSIGQTSGKQPLPDSVDYNLWVGPAPMKPLTRKRLHYDWHWMWDYGNGDLGNQGIHQMDIARWGLGRGELPQSVIGLGGRFGYEDDGETPNTHVTIADYGDTQLIFEVRGLKTKRFRGAGVGVVFHGTEGYVVLTSYTRGAAFDLDGNKIRDFSGGGDHYGNFLAAVKSRKHTDLNADILQGHLSSALCHLGNVSYRTGQDVPFSKQSKAFGDNQAAYETFERVKSYLGDNRVALENTPYRLGKKIVIDPATETVVNDQRANALMTRDYRKGFEVPGTLAKA